MQNVTLIYPSRDQMTGTIWDFRQLFRLMKEKARIIILSVVVCMSLAGAYLAVAPRIYSSQAVVYVEQRDKRVVNIESVDPEDLEAMEVMKTVEQSFGTDEMMLRVIDANHLRSVAEFNGNNPAQPATDDQLIKALTKHVSIKVRRGTRLIDILTRSKDPKLAQTIAQSFVDEYLHLDMDQHSGIATEANSFLIREADQLKGNLEIAEKTLQTYREQHNNALSLQDSQNVVVDSLKDLNTRLGQARADRIKAESDYNQYKLIGDNDPKALLAIHGIADSPLVLDAQRAVNQQRAEIADLSRRYRAEHPKYIQAQSRLAQLESDYEKTILRVSQDVKTGYQSAVENEQKLQDALNDQERASSDLNTIAIPYATLVHNVSADRDLYQSIITRLKETDITKLIETAPVRMIEAPRTTSKPVSPKIPLILLASIFMGVGTGAGICLLLHSMDTSVRSVEEAEQTLRMSVVAAVPRLKKSKAAGDWKGVPMIGEPYSVTAEAFRSLRTVLELKEETVRQVLMVTSASPNEGKTFCSTNTAVAFAQQGYRTLIIDTDLRNPSVAGALHVPGGTPGLADYLTGACTIDRAIQETGVEHLSVLPAGTVARNPSELLSGENFEQLFTNAVILGFERVVIDTAPINAVSDALHLVRHATFTCLVVRAGHTPRRPAQRAQTALVNARVMEAGIVLNCIHTLQYYTYGTNESYGGPTLAKA